MNILLTGGHSGIGLELSKKLLAEGHHLGLILRSAKRQADAEAALGKTDKLDFFHADLSKRADIKRMGYEVANKWDKLDGLFNNAGVLLDQAYYSAEGNEMHLEVNTLTPYLLTEELMPLLEKGETPFVINTATGGLHNQKGIDIPELKKPTKFRKLLGSYLQSKIAMTALMGYQAGQHPKVRFAAVDPGPNKTPMTQGAGMPGWLLPLRNLFFPPPSKGGGLLYKGAFDPAHQGQSGVYITGNKIKPMKFALMKADVEALLKSPGVQVQ